MVNTYRKGKRIELLAKKELEHYRWKVIQAPGSTRFNKHVDFFGLFDLIALRDRDIKFVQVKANRKPLVKERNRLLKFKKAHCTYNRTVEWWAYWNVGKRKEKKGFEVIVL